MTDPRCLKDACVHYRHHADEAFAYCSCFATGDHYEFLHDSDDSEEEVECLHPSLVRPSTLDSNTAYSTSITSR